MFSVDPVATADGHRVQNVTERCSLQAVLIMCPFPLNLGENLCLLHVLVIPQQVANGGQVENKMNLPVPVYLRPLDQKDVSMKVCKSRIQATSVYISLNSEGI